MQYPDGVCKIAGLTGWTAVVNGRLAEELVHLDDTYVSLGAAIHQLVQGDLTLGPTALYVREFILFSACCLRIVA